MSSVMKGLGLPGIPQRPTLGKGRLPVESKLGYGLLVADRAAEIKIEVSPVLRGAVFPESLRRIVERAKSEFGFAEVPVVSYADLYAGKIVAALDRQHPRDLFDVKLLLAAEGIGDELFRAFLVYLISHDGSIARVLNPAAKPLKDLFERQFVVMTAEAVTLADLEQARTELISALHERLGDREKTFLISLKRGEPQWDLLGVAHAPDLPAVRWKLQNLAQMAAEKRREAIGDLDAYWKTSKHMNASTITRNTQSLHATLNERQPAWQTAFSFR